MQEMQIYSLLIYAQNFQAEFKKQVLKIWFPIPIIVSPTNKHHHPTKQRNSITLWESGFSVNPHWLLSSHLNKHLVLKLKLHSNCLYLPTSCPKRRYQIHHFSLLWHHHTMFLEQIKYIDRYFPAAAILLLAVDSQWLVYK